MFTPFSVMRQHASSHRKTSTRLKRLVRPRGSLQSVDRTPETVDMRGHLAFALLLVILAARASSLNTEAEARRRMVGLARDIERKSICQRI